MKGYHDIAGDGGSRVLEQVAEQRARIADGLAGVRHLVAVGSGKGGVGKSTLTLHLAGAMRARGLRVAILDADFNGPSQARMAGVQDAVFVPGSTKVALPRTRNGIGVFSMGSLIPETAALEFESAARGESHTWRATREFALLGEIIGSFEWGALDVLLFDLPPGADRTVQYADFLGARTSFLLVTIPSEVARGVVARSVAALAKGPNRLLGYVENMSGYFCRDCNSIRPLFSDWGALPRQTRLHASASAEATADLAGAGHEPSLCDREGGRSRGPLEPRSARVAHSPSLVRSDWGASGAPGPSELGIPCLGTIPFDPELARHCDLGLPVAGLDDTPTGRALEQITERLLDALDPARKSDR